jgi:hypothetical protein
VIEAVLEGFALNTMFNPQALDEARLAAIVPQVLATIFPRV